MRLLAITALLPLLVVATPMLAATKAQKMETCKFGADNDKLEGAKRDVFIKKCMANGNYEPAARREAMKKLCWSRRRRRWPSPRPRRPWRRRPPTRRSNSAPHRRAHGAQPARHAGIRRESGRPRAVQGVRRPGSIRILRGGTGRCSSEPAAPPHAHSQAPPAAIGFDRGQPPHAGVRRRKGGA